MRSGLFVAAGVSLLAYGIRGSNGPRQAPAPGLSPNDVLTALDNIGNISGQTKTLFDQVKNDKNTRLVPRTLNNLQEFTTSALSTSLRIQKANRPDYMENDQDDICGTYSNFLNVHQALQQSIINAKNVVGASPFNAPVASISRIVQVTIDNLAFNVNQLVPACAWQFQDAQNSLDLTLDQVVQIYRPSQTQKK